MPEGQKEVGIERLHLEQDAGKSIHDMDPQNTLVDLNEDISKIEDADMAELLTKLQKLLTNKEAAQATFSRLSSKNLFDFLG